MAIWIYPLVNYGKSQFLMGKSTISMAMASIAMLNYQRLWWAKFSVCNRPQVDCNVDPPVVGIFFDRKKKALSEWWFHDQEGNSRFRNTFIF